MAEPHRRFTGGRLVIATHNKGKVAEIAALLAAFPVEAVAAGALGLPEPDETETTFIGNATLKARAAALATGSPALADDSGIEVSALNGAPGVYTADWAGVPRDFMVAMRRVEDAIAESGNPDRSARFVCALSLVWPDGHVEAFQGKVDGHLVWPPRGDRGFGFDPVFVPHGHDITFAEMDPAAKHAMSHRADAFAQLVAACFTAWETATP